MVRWCPASIGGPTSTPLDYRPPGQDPRPPVTSGATDVALLATGVQHLLVFLVACTTLDNGEVFKTALVVAAAFWLVVVAVAVRRRGELGRTDRLFIAIGYPAMLVPCLIVRWRA